MESCHLRGEKKIEEGGKKRRGRLLHCVETWRQGREMSSNRRQTETGHGGNKGRTNWRAWVTKVTSTCAALCKAQREEASILYYPPASLASWRIFHLIPAVTMENWPRRCVPLLRPLLWLSPLFFIKCTQNEEHVGARLSGSRLPVTDIRFTRRSTAPLMAQLVALLKQRPSNTAQTWQILTVGTAN